MTAWIPKNHHEACMRAAARRRQVAERRAKAAARRRRVAELMTVFGTGYGAQAKIARELGVHKTTISRDFRVLLVKIEPGEPCPLCGHGSENSSPPGSAE